MEDGTLEVTIKDNGKGIADVDKAMESGSKGIGLNNIRRRLELQYGLDDLVKVSSIEGVCTIVVLHFPKVDPDESIDC